MLSEEAFAGPVIGRADREGIPIDQGLVRFHEQAAHLGGQAGPHGKQGRVSLLAPQELTDLSVETAGHFDLDAELKIWISGNPVPIQKRFNKQLNIYHVQSILAGYVLG
jgi:hypothetical protein